MRSPCILLSLISGILSSCSWLHFPHRAYIGPYHEPLLVSDKGDKQFSAGISPFKYVYGSGAFSPVDHLALQGNAGGYFGLINTSATFYYYNRIRNSRWYAGPTIGFQDNNIHRRVRDIFDTYWKMYSYSCRFRCAGGAAGFAAGEKVQLHCGVRILYNVVDRYNYYFESSDRYYPDNVERVSYLIPDFFSFHPSLGVLFKSKKRAQNYLKLQLELNIVQTTLKHRYQTTGQTWYGYSYNFAKTYFHPIASPFAFTVSYVFYSKKKTK